MHKPIGPLADPDAEKRSLMLARKVLCNGEATGVRCAHYWSMIRNEPSQDPDMLVMGGKLRFCRAWGTEPLEFGEGTSELATLGDDEPLYRGCERYWPAGALPGYRTENGVNAEIPAEDALIQIKKRGVSPRQAYDAVFEEYADTYEAVNQRFIDVPLREDLKDYVPAAPGSADEEATLLSIEDVLGKLDTEEPPPSGFIHKLRRFFRL